LGEGLKYPLRVARVIEEVFKGKYTGQKKTYYVITTSTELPALTLRELAKLRWHIENETFKALNEQCHSKHAYVRDRAMEALVLILFATFIQLQAYRLWVEEEKTNIPRWLKVSFWMLCQLFFRSLNEFEDFFVSKY
jgi:hypothetical protein